MHRKSWYMLLAHVAVVILVAAPVSVFAWIVQQDHWRHVATERITAVALSTATLPIVVQSLGDHPDTVTDNEPDIVALGHTVEAVRSASGMDYIVIANPQGVRLTHVLPGRVGEEVSTDPSEPLAGTISVGVEDGEVGRTFRVKVPVRNEAGTIVGIVSAGVLESRLISEERKDTAQLALAVGGALLVGALAATASSYFIRRRIYGIEPAQVAPLQSELAAEHRAAEMLRANAHEFANRMHVIQGLLQVGKPLEAERFIAALPGVARGNAEPTELLGEPLLDAVVAAKQALARERGLNLEVDVESDAAHLPYTVGVEEVTVLSNLLTNALEAAEDRILVGVYHEDDDALSLVVQDDGAGVADGIDPLMRGVSTKPGERGVGLALVSRVARDRGGSVEYGQGALGGAEFAVRLPAPQKHG